MKVVVYHVTDAKNVAAIRAHGFRPTEGDAGIGIYFWDDLSYAQRYARERGNWGDLQNPVILLVPVDADVLAPVEPDFSMVAEVEPEDGESIEDAEEDLLDRYHHTRVLRTQQRRKLRFKVL